MLRATRKTKMRCNKCHRPMRVTSSYDGACACGGVIEAVPKTRVDYSVLGVKKGATRAQEKLAERSQKTVARKSCCEVVWSRAGGHCEDCGVRVHLSHVDFRRVGHVHEIVSRGQGGDATDPNNCLLLCFACHFSGPSGAHRKSERRPL